MQKMRKQLRIFLVLLGRTTCELQNGQLWFRNLYEPLLELGHEVFLFDIAKFGNCKRPFEKWTEKDRQRFGESLWEVFTCENSKDRFDLFFSYLDDYKIKPEVIDEIRNLGLPTANFSCNNTHQFYLVEKISPHFDYNLHSEKDVAEKFRAIGANPVWFPMAANPKYYKPYNIPRTIDVSFCGQNYATRPYYIWYLLENGVDVHAYGPGWRKKEDKLLLRKPIRWLRRSRNAVMALVSFSTEKRLMESSRLAYQDFKDNLLRKYSGSLHFPLSDEEMIRKCSESKISLGFLEVFDLGRPDKPKKLHLHLREFEAPMCGALYFTQYSEELAEFYEPDKEVVIFRNEYELLDKVRYYLSHPAEAEQIRRAGLKRARECHTWHNRFNKLFGEMGLV